MQVGSSNECSNECRSEAARSASLGSSTSGIGPFGFQDHEPCRCQLFSTHMACDPYFVVYSAALGNSKYP